jgi:hypothetical protein
MILPREWDSEGGDMVESESPSRSRRWEDWAGAGLQSLKGLGQVGMRLVRCSAVDNIEHGIRTRARKRRNDKGIMTRNGVNDRWAEWATTSLQAGYGEFKAETSRDRK